MMTNQQVIALMAASIMAHVWGTSGIWDTPTCPYEDAVVRQALRLFNKCGAEKVHIADWRTDPTLTPPVVVGNAPPGS